MLCVVRIPNLSMAVPVRSNVASHSSTYSSLINQPAGLGLPVRLWERLGRRGSLVTTIRRRPHSLILRRMLQWWRRILQSCCLGMLCGVPENHVIRIVV